MSLILNPYRYAGGGGGNPHNKIVVMNTTVSTGIRYMELDGTSLTRINISPTFGALGLLARTQWLDDQRRFVYHAGSAIRTVSESNTDNVVRATHGSTPASFSLSDDGTKLYVGSGSAFGYYDDLGSASWTWNLITATQNNAAEVSSALDRYIVYLTGTICYWRNLTTGATVSSSNINPNVPYANSIDVAGQRVFQFVNGADLYVYDISGDTLASRTLVQAETGTFFEPTSMCYCPANDRCYFALNFDQNVYWIDATAGGAKNTLVDTGGRMVGVQSFYMSPP